MRRPGDLPFDRPVKIRSLFSELSLRSDRPVFVGTSVKGPGKLTLAR
jgi:hypothetical protein